MVRHEPFIFFLEGVGGGGGGGERDLCFFVFFFVILSQSDYFSAKEENFVSNFKT